MNKLFRRGITLGSSCVTTSYTFSVTACGTASSGQAEESCGTDRGGGTEVGTDLDGACFAGAVEDEDFRSGGCEGAINSSRESIGMLIASDVRSVSTGLGEE